MPNYDTSYDNYFSKHPEIKFYPWVGKDYKNEKVKLLIVGESHYFKKGTNANEKKENNKNKNFTRDCFEDSTIPIYYKIQAILANNLIDYSWVSKKIAFYNFFQKCVSENREEKRKNIKEGKNDNLLKQSHKAFIEVLKILNPNVVIVLGKSNMWYWIGANEGNSEYLTKKECKNKQVYYFKNLQNKYIFHIMHPAANEFDIVETASFIGSTFADIKEACKKKQLECPEELSYPIKKS